MKAVVDLNLLTKRIRNKMELLDLNQAQLAKLAGITPAALSQILSKERTPSSSVLVKLAKALSESLDFLVGKTNESKLQEIIQQPDVQNFYKGFSDLSQIQKQQVVDMIDFLKKKTNNLLEKPRAYPLLTSFFY